MPAVSKTATGGQEALQGVSQPLAGNQEARGAVARAGIGFQEVYSIGVDAAFPFNITIAVGKDGAFPYNRTGPMGIDAAFPFNLPGPVLVDAQFPFGIHQAAAIGSSPLVPRDWTQKVVTQGSRVQFQPQGTSPFQDLKVKSWRYRSSIQTMGFTVDQVEVVYANVSPTLYTDITNALMAAPWSTDAVGIYVTINGQETLIFNGVVRQWYLEEGPDGIMEAHLLAQDRRVFLIDTPVPQGLFLRGMLEDPDTGTREFNLTFLQAVQILGSLAAVTIDTSGCPDYPVAPHLTFSGRTTVASAIGRLMRVYQMINMFKVDLIRTGMDSYKMVQRPNPLPSGDQIAPSGTTLRKYTKAYVPRVQRAAMYGYTGKSKAPRMTAKCARDLKTGIVTNCTMPVLQIGTSVVQTPYALHDALGRVSEEGYVLTTTQQPGSQVIQIETIGVQYTYKADGTPGQSVKVHKIVTNEYDGLNRLVNTTTLQYADEVLVARDYHEVTYEGGFTTVSFVNGLIEDAAKRVILEGSTSEKLSALDPLTGDTLAPPQMAIVGRTVMTKTPSGGYTFKNWARWIPGIDSQGNQTMVVDAQTHEVSPGDQRPATPSGGRPLYPAGTGPYDASATLQGGVWTGSDGMLGDDAVANQIAGWALEAGNTWHDEIEITALIDPNFLFAGKVITVPDTLGLAMANFWITEVEAQDSPEGTLMTLHADTYVVGNQNDLGGTTFPSGYSPTQFTLTDIQGKQETIQFLHGIIMSGPDGGGNFEIFCQEEQTVWQSIPIRGALQQFPLYPGDQIVLERIGSVLYGLI